MYYPIVISPVLWLPLAPDWDEASRKAETKGRMLAVQVEVGHAGTP